MRWRWPTVVANLLCTLTVASPLSAWDAVGHRVVAQLAWDELDAPTQQRATALLAAMPASAGLAEMSLAAIPAERPRKRFLDASVWPDLMRDDRFPERRQRYHHGRWHYINHFWDQPPGQEPRRRDDLHPPAENILSQLPMLRSQLADVSHPAAERGEALAWVLHLVGDIHQPLHTTARVTASEPEGDRGGNLFKLRRRDNLHRYWDSVLRREYPRDSVVEIAQRIASRHPRSSLAAALTSDQPREWSEEGLKICLQRVYPDTLERGRRPPRSYRRMVAETAELRIAKAGQRLADLLQLALSEDLGAD